MSRETVMQLLGTRVRVVSDDPEIFEALDYLVPGAEQEIPLSARARFAVRRSADGFVLAQDGGEESAVMPGRTALLAELFERIHVAALQPFRDAVRIHAASGAWDDQAFLAIGDKGSGKTSLALRMLFDGCRVFGDELVLLHEGEALAFPRKFYVKPGTLPLLPELANLAARLPSVRDGHGGAIRAFEPGDAGLPWRIERFRPEVIAVLEPAFGDPSRITELARFRTVQRILEQSGLPAHRKSEAIRDVCRAVDGCRTFLLRVGRPGEAGELLRKAILGS